MLKNKEALSMAERIVLDYLIENKTLLKDFSVEKIAEAAYTSPASVVRMCKKLGYNGFKDFKIDFILANSKVEIPETSEYTDVILIKDQNNGKKAIENNIRALEETINLYDEKTYTKAASLIMNARKILIFGKGSSFLVCKDLEMKLRRINKFCVAQGESHDQFVDASFINNKDVVIFISNSGKTKEIISSALLAKENKTPIISITRIGSSILADISDVVLYTSALESEFRSAAMTSRISQMSVVDALYAKCAYTDIDRSIQALETTYRTIKKFKR
ncbi:MurR/RpiR family transcriptional regulator [Acholeplasma laidlawii]|nr:MurR/RpiR family transcriptional regulator [Acholeplasma laidlawii]NWH10554.1 MurR/RpiR family transcriptional regulator [Acholeplasma laidlawii]NWH11939.1 MurR/RpiR family transcriptional regulator [Acholeplasma laidlawii]NWH13968.1 MurR/RpiR family transcriptional regulator [Acholeplasma laidlawii]